MLTHFTLGKISVKLFEGLFSTEAFQQASLLQPQSRFQIEKQVFPQTWKKSFTKCPCDLGKTHKNDVS